MGLIKLFLSLVALMLVSIPTSVGCPEINSIAIPVNLQSIRNLRCGNYLGTGEIIGHGLVLTAQHVVGDSHFCIDTEAMVLGTVIRSSVTQDIALIAFSPIELPNTSIQLTCQPFIEDFYVSYGWAGGFYFMRNLMVGTSLHANMMHPKNLKHGYRDLAYLRGLVIQGMSGGPIVDLQGRMHGMNTMTTYPNKPNIALSRELRDTFICGKIPRDLRTGRSRPPVRH